MYKYLYHNINMIRLYTINKYIVFVFKMLTQLINKLDLY